MQSLTEYSPLASLLKASWQAAVLILLVLAAQWAFGRRLNPRWRYGLWLLVLIRLALPWTIPSSASVFNLLTLSGASSSLVGWRAAAAGPSSPAGQATAVAHTEPLDYEPALQSAPAPRLSTSARWLLGLWLAGASALTAGLWVTHVRLSRRVARRRPLTDAALLDLLENCKQEMGVQVPVTLVETGEVGSPALFGFVRPRLLLPAGLRQSFSAAELRYVFLHELGHIKRSDILIGWLTTALQILHWFNPLVWLAFHRMRVDRELACDALALAHLRAEENQPYGRTIIKLLETFGRSAWAPSLAGTVENKNQLKERISMIAQFKKTNHGLALAVALFAGLGLVTLTDAQSGASQLSKDLVGTWILVGKPGEIGEMPAAGGRIKSLTDTHWSVTQADPETGATIFHHGGTYALKGNEYAETVEYANESSAELIKKTFKFKLKVEGDTLTQQGIGNPWNEVWKRAKSDSIKPHKSDSVALHGKWRGHEIGAGASGASSLLIQGSNLEFHGADTNEWYQGTFSLYDTIPKQLVIKITGCPVPQYVGLTGHAIYELKDGTLTITGNEPGNPAVPAGFDASGARKLVFKPE
jgi:beta-lactamase regulating signal transducer with metallopeptidase domain